MNQINAVTISPRLVARVNKKTLFRKLLLGVVAYAFILWCDENKLEKIVFGFGFVIVLPLGIRELLWHNSKVVIDRSGVLDSRSDLGVIRWDDIIDVYLSDFQNVTYVCLKVKNTHKYLSRRSTLTRLLWKFHVKKNKISPFSISCSVLDVNPVELYHAIMANWHEFMLSRPESAQ